MNAPEGAHAHDHGEAHGHGHAPASFGRPFAIGIALNLGFVIVEAIFGIFSDSVALLADAGHDVSDVLALAVAWLASELVKRAPPPGRRPARLVHSRGPVQRRVPAGDCRGDLVGSDQEARSAGTGRGKNSDVVAAVGIVINGQTAWLFAGGKRDINLRGAFVHMASDALASAGVVVAGFVITLSGWLWLDPVVSLIINAVIVWATWGLLRDALGMAMAAAPFSHRSRGGAGVPCRSARRGRSA